MSYIKQLLNLESAGDGWDGEGHDHGEDQRPCLVCGAATGEVADFLGREPVCSLCQLEELARQQGELPGEPSLPKELLEQCKRGVPVASESNVSF